MSVSEDMDPLARKENLSARLLSHHLIDGTPRDREYGGFYALSFLSRRSHGSARSYAVPQATLVVKTIPQRLRDFRNKTIVFDSTLITHHYHFAQIPHEYKHVLGWYRLITELRSNNVNAICVFDGVGRSAGKVLENARRQSNRRLGLTRWSMEIKRQERLQALLNLLKRTRSLPLEHREATIAAIREAVRERREEARENQPVISGGSILEAKDDIESRPVGIAAESYEEDHTLIGDKNVDFTPSVLEDAEKVTWIDESLIQDEDFLYPDQRLPPSIRYDISEQVAALYSSHEEMSKALQAMTPPVDFSGDLPEEALESRKQFALTKDEERVWARVQRLIAEPKYIRIPKLLELLIQRSKVLSEGYERRSRPPTEETYEQCRMIIEALGVPCIEATGPYEAEGLAAALVRRRLAHFVASEDTDVLVYGAPLLRHITLRYGAICSISPEEVRRVLRLSRAAFMDFAILVGTDFVPRLRNVGPVRALNFITTHSRIERVVKYETRFVPEDVPGYLDKVRVARRIFTTLPPVPPREKLKQGEVNKERVTEILSKFGLSRAAEDADWDPQVSLTGNYFGDNPTDEDRSVGLTETHFR